METISLSTARLSQFGQWTISARNGTQVLLVKAMKHMHLLGWLVPLELKHLRALRLPAWSNQHSVTIGRDKPGSRCIYALLSRKTIEVKEYIIELQEKFQNQGNGDNMHVYIYIYMYRQLVYIYIYI